MNTLRNRPLDYWLLWLVALASLAMNAWLVRAVMGTRRQLGQGAAVAAQAVDKLRNSSIDYSVGVQQSLPISLTVPLSITVNVPISLTLPIDTRVTVPLETPFGVIPLTFPVKTTIPVRVRPEVPVVTDIPISTTVPIALEVPIHLLIADTDLGQSLAEAQAYLEQVAAEMQSSFLFEAGGP